jgi:hypothetical protein
MKDDRHVYSPPRSHISRLIIQISASCLASTILAGWRQLGWPVRQQVTMLRQSVKRPRATAADRMFRSKRDVNKRKHHPTRRTRRSQRKPSTPRPSPASPASTTPTSSGLTGVSSLGHSPFHIRFGCMSAKNIAVIGPFSYGPCPVGLFELDP